MDCEIWNRFRTAFYSLFPENVGRHLDAIEKELRMMAVEIAADVAKECGKCNARRQEQDPKREPEVKKVDIL